MRWSKITRVSRKKKEIILCKYNEYLEKSIKAKTNGNQNMFDKYNLKLKTIRMTLTLLEIHIKGINQV